jgi:hypothetical protein
VHHALEFARKSYLKLLNTYHALLQKIQKITITLYNRRTLLMTNKLNLKTALKTALITVTVLASLQTAVAKDISQKCELRQKCTELQKCEERKAWFGDLHVHTSIDIDSYMGYNTNDPSDAYRFAKGEATLPIAQAANPPPNVSLKISKPLDFAAVTPHAEMMADVLCLNETNQKIHPKIYFSKTCQSLRDHDDASFGAFEAQLLEDQPQPPPDICPPVDSSKINPICVKATKSRWQEIQQIANDHYDPDKFTTFIAYEHTPTTSSGGAFHRNVIFRSTSVPNNVLSAYNAYTASDLWRKLDETCIEKKGCQALVIPHMINMSNGMFFAEEDRLRAPYTQEDYERRQRFEPLIEIHQTKGNSECLLNAGTTDEFCQFEPITRPCTNFDQASYPDVKCVEDSYIRNGLKKGLVLAGKPEFGFNPFKYSFIGSTDNQNGTPGATEEFQYVAGGVFGATPKGRLTHQGLDSPNRGYNPGGLAGVWANENTRESIFDALQCKETFATSGTRIRVRFFAGWDYPSSLHKYTKETMLQDAYNNGTPMGGDISLNNNAQTENQAPKFLVWAVKDPQSANLQRLQIIKGWEDKDGAHEQVYDVACSDGLEPNNAHRCPDNGAKVDLKGCNYSEFIGSTELKVTWTDPDFEPSRRAFYYARVLENPTCRWSTYDANTLGIAPVGDVPSTIQERAWSSPIWYTPSTVVN